MPQQRSLPELADSFRKCSVVCGGHEELVMTEIAQAINETFDAARNTGEGE